MRWVIALWLLLGVGLSGPAKAQLTVSGVGGGGFGGAAASYTGPGDVLSGALAFWGLQGYNAAYNGKTANVCLPADTTCADVTVQGTTVTVPGGLSTCNNSTTICTVKVLYDQSGALACSGSVVCDATQNTIANRFTFVVPGASNGCPKSTQYCFASNTAVFYATPNFTRAQPIGVAVVVNHTAHAHLDWIVRPASTNIQIGYDTSGVSVLRLFAGVSIVNSPPPSGLADGSWHALQFVLNGASSSINGDGVGSGNTSPGTSGWSAEAINVGGDNSATFGFEGNIGEIGMWPGLSCTLTGNNCTAGNVFDLNNNAHSVGRWNF